MELFKEQAEEDARIFPKTPIDEFREELSRWITGMNVEVTLVAPAFVKDGMGFFWLEVPDDYRGEPTRCRIRIEAMGSGITEEYLIEYAIEHAGHIAERMLAVWGREFARRRFLKKDAMPRVTSRQ